MGGILNFQNLKRTISWKLKPSLLKFSYLCLKLAEHAAGLALARRVVTLSALLTIALYTHKLNVWHTGCSSYCDQLLYCFQYDILYQSLLRIVEKDRLGGLGRYEVIPPEIHVEYLPK